MNLPIKIYAIIFTALSLAVVTPLSVFGVTSAITKVVFTTDTRTVAPNVLSEVITIQTQNSSGEAEKIEETADITFTSSSPTGEFLGSTGNPVSIIMSKGSANRNFYYRDSAEGTHVLTATVRVRSSGLTWTATQNIIVGSNTGNAVDTTSSGLGSTPSSDNSMSAHSGSSELTQEELITLSTVGIGRDRRVPINVPIQFDLASAPPRGVYDWSFGDGTAGSGQNVRHTYQETGDYVVVLNGNVQGKKIVARTTVHVYTPSVLVLPARAPQSLTIQNTGSTEINVGEWVLVEAGGVERGIPRDTILLPKSSITVGIPPRTQDVHSIALYYPNRTLIARYDPDTWNSLLSVADIYQKQKAVVPTIKQDVTIVTAPPPLEKIAITSTSSRTIVLPLRRSWWESFIDTVFAR